MPAELLFAGTISKGIQEAGKEKKNRKGSNRTMLKQYSYFFDILRLKQMQIEESLSENINISCYCNLHLLDWDCETLCLLTLQMEEPV